MGDEIWLRCGAEAASDGEQNLVQMRDEICAKLGPNSFHTKPFFWMARSELEHDLGTDFVSNLYKI